MESAKKKSQVDILELKMHNDISEIKNLLHGFDSRLNKAEDGIRDHCVTGVQTCALPI